MDNFKPTPNSGAERLSVSVQLATPADWKNYRDIIIEAFEKNPQSFSQRQLVTAREKPDEEWERGFQSNENSFAVLAKVGEETIGAGGARKTRREGVWFGTSLYLADKFKVDRFSTVRKMLTTIEEELKNRKANKVILYLKKGEGQDRIQTLYERFGFKVNTDPEINEEGYVYMEKIVNSEVA